MDSKCKTQLQKWNSVGPAVPQDFNWVFVLHLAWTMSFHTVHPLHHLSGWEIKIKISLSVYNCGSEGSLNNATDAVMRVITLFPVCIKKMSD